MARAAAHVVIVLGLLYLPGFAFARDFRVAASSLADIFAEVNEQARQAASICAERTSTFCRDKPDDNYAHPCLISSYLTCTQGRSAVQVCKKDLVWDASRHECSKDWPSGLQDPSASQELAVAATSPKLPDSFCHENPEGRYPSPDNVEDFIQCTDGVALTLHCNRDLVWSTTCSCCTLPSTILLPPVKITGHVDLSVNAEADEAVPTSRPSSDVAQS